MRCARRWHRRLLSALCCCCCCCSVPEKPHGRETISVIRSSSCRSVSSQQNCASRMSGRSLATAPASSLNATAIRSRVRRKISPCLSARLKLVILRNRLRLADRRFFKARRFALSSLSKQLALPFPSRSSCFLIGVAARLVDASESIGFCDENSKPQFSSVDRGQNGKQTSSSTPSIVCSLLKVRGVVVVTSKPYLHLRLLALCPRFHAR